LVEEEEEIEVGEELEERYDPVCGNFTSQVASTFTVNSIESRETLSLSHIVNIYIDPSFLFSLSVST
jgi:hypothetical protein